jgi:hypothetical protein
LVAGSDPPPYLETADMVTRPLVDGTPSGTERWWNEAVYSETAPCRRSDGKQILL